MSKYLSGNIGPAERKELLSWAESDPENRAFFDEMIQLWSLSGEYEPAPFETDTEQAWLKLEPNLLIDDLIDEMPTSSTEAEPETIPAPLVEPKTKVVQLRSRRRIWSIAAAIAVLLVCGSVVFNQIFRPVNYTAVATLEGEKKEVLLPDGTKVILNQNSSLSYSAKFKDRDVELEGEAFFDVASMPDRPFTISSGDVLTTVVGTAFNIRAYPDEEEVEVAVEEGIVEVATKLEESKTSPVTSPVQRLTPGKMVVYSKAEKALSEASEQTDVTLIWKKSSLEFNNTPMIEVASILERYFNIQVDLSASNYQNCPITLNELIQPNLEEVLITLESTFDYKIEQQADNTYIIQGGICY
ncbi:MAG: FecR domain-containing protein [Bacteroidota bacterium]